MSNEIESVESVSSDLIERLNNWVGERPFLRRSERVVRRRIANAVITDILNSVGSANVPPKLEQYRTNVASGVVTAIGKLRDLPVGERGIVVEKANMIDQITGKIILTRIRRVEGGWITEELRPDQSVISQAEIGDDGKLSMTLDYRDQRYADRKANPQIINRTDLPTGAKVLFLNHAAALGVISWGGK